MRSTFNILFYVKFEDDNLAFVRDIFVFVCFTALSFIDVKNLTTDNIVDINGDKWIISKRHKTNIPFQSTLDMERIVMACFRKPLPDEPCRPVKMTAILDVVSSEFPFIRPQHSTKVQVGLALAAQGFKSKRDEFGMTYYAVPLRAVPQ